MDQTIIKSVANGVVMPTIGKYIKDGQDLDYVLTFEKYDPLTGEPVQSVQESVSYAWVQGEIKTRETELQNLYDFLEKLQDPNVTVLADYTGQ